MRPGVRVSIYMVFDPCKYGYCILPASPASIDNILDNIFSREPCKSYLIKLRVTGARKTPKPLQNPSRKSAGHSPRVHVEALAFSAMGKRRSDAMTFEKPEPRRRPRTSALSTRPSSSSASAAACMALLTTAAAPSRPHTVHSLCTQSAHTVHLCAAPHS